MSRQEILVTNDPRDAMPMHDMPQWQVTEHIWAFEHLSRDTNVTEEQINAWLIAAEALKDDLEQCRRSVQVGFLESKLVALRVLGRDKEAYDVLSGLINSQLSSWTEAPALEAYHVALLKRGDRTDFRTFQRRNRQWMTDESLEETTASTPSVASTEHSSFPTTFAGNQPIVPLATSVLQKVGVGQSASVYVLASIKEIIDRFPELTFTDDTSAQLLESYWNRAFEAIKTVNSPAHLAEILAICRWETYQVLRYAQDPLSEEERRRQLEQFDAMNGLFKELYRSVEDSAFGTDDVLEMLRTEIDAAKIRIQTNFESPQQPFINRPVSDLVFEKILTETQKSMWDARPEHLLRLATDSGSSNPKAYDIRIALEDMVLDLEFDLLYNYAFLQDYSITNEALFPFGAVQPSALVLKGDERYISIRVVVSEADRQAGVGTQQSPQ